MTATDPSARDLRRITAGLMLAIFLAALTQTIVGTALPTIGRAFHDFAAIPWIVTAYLLAATSALPVYGTLSDAYGRRLVLLVALAIFIAGSALCAIAPSMDALIGGRLLQGIGGGGLIALPETIIADMVSPRERAGYQVYIASAFLAASLAGPVAGGFFVDHLSWTMIFWINLPLGLLAILVVDAPLRRLPRQGHPHRLDGLGAALLIAAVSTLIVAVSWGGRTYGWGSPATVGMLVLAAALSTAFAARMRRAPDPLIPPEVLADKVVRACLAAAALGVGLTVGLSIYVPIFFQQARHLSAGTTGLVLLPFMAGSTLGALLAGRAMERRTHYKRVPLAAMPLAALAAAALVMGIASLPTWVIAALLAVLSIALGTLLPVATVAIQNAVAARHLGTATATSNIARQLGASVTVALFGTLVFGHRPEDASTPFTAVFGIVALGAVVAFLVILAMEERALAAAPGPRAE